jgi:hypothetical protein
MLAKLHPFSLLGIDALPVEVEVDVSAAALPKVILVGLPEQAVKVSTHRIERAMVTSGRRIGCAQFGPGATMHLSERGSEAGR